MIEEALKEFVRQRKGKGLVVAQVVTVDTEDMIFDCVDGDGNEYPDVRTNAVPGKSGFWVVPRVGSTVMICDLGDLEQDYILIQAGEIDDFYIYVLNETEVHIDDVEIRLGGGKVEPAVLGEVLNENLTTLIDELKNVVSQLQTFSTTQAAASTGPLAALAPGFTALGTQMPAITAALTTLQTDIEDHLSTIVKITP